MREGKRDRVRGGEREVRRLNIKLVFVGEYSHANFLSVSLLNLDFQS